MTDSARNPGSSEDQPSVEPTVGEADIAVVGMSAHLPGARDVREYWLNLRNGVESTVRYTDEELIEAGVAADQLRDPRYVPVGAPLDGVADFDAEFFGFSPKDAAIADPQHRDLLERAWEALEDAGYPPERFDGQIGVFAGCGMNSYLMFNLLTNPKLMESVGMFLIRHTANDKDFLATRISYELNLTGPSINVQTACSTSLVAIHQACQSLLSGESDMALAGGVTIEVPHRQGYVYKEGEVLSPDGHCHAFDHRAQGTIFGSGAGLVVLRRAQDAVDAGDHIYALIRGSAVNNDGSNKVGYLAPSVDGQAAAIAEAIAVSGVSADSISYVECHGTGTALGDPIEVAALTQAFRNSSDGTGFCGIGSVKTNIGHLDTAAGVASFIKVCKALEHRELPPSLNFERPNPEVDFDSSPFYVNAERRDWDSDGPRRAGINSLGVGGTNAHVIVEEAPVRQPSGPSRSWQLLTLSARNPAALDDATDALAEHLRSTDDPLADIAYTLKIGRRDFDRRRIVVCDDVDGAVHALTDEDRTSRPSGTPAADQASVAFMFPGGGAQYVQMGRDLFESEPLFTKEVRRGIDWMRQHKGVDLEPIWFPTEEAQEEAVRSFERPSIQLPALFILEHALARLWMSWGVMPKALIGHSMGENTAACIAGVMSFEDGLGLVALRGELFERVPKGGMLSVQLPASELEPLLGDDLALAAINSPGLCVASGPIDALDNLERELAGRDVESQRIKIDIAAHSRLVEPILDEFGAYLRSIRLSEPEIRFISNRTGTWITPEDATDPDYWVRHLRESVRFADGVGTLLGERGCVLLEVGPGKILGSLARQHDDTAPGQLVVSSLRHPDEKVSDLAFLLGVLGRLWMGGVTVDWDLFYGDEKRNRVSLPTYQFQRQEYWIDPGEVAFAGAEPEATVEKLEDPDDWFYRARWSESPLVGDAQEQGGTWLIFLDQLGVGMRMAATLRSRGARVLTVREGDTFYRLSDDEFVLAPEEGRPGYDQLVEALVSSDLLPDEIVHLWTVTSDRTVRPGSSFYHHAQERGFYSLLFLAQAWAGQGLKHALRLNVLSNGVQAVAGEGSHAPEKATMLGPCRVIPRELPDVTCRNVDLGIPMDDKPRRRRPRRDLDEQSNTALDEILRGSEQFVAYRGKTRHVLDYVRSVPEQRSVGHRVRDGGVYLITGGLGGIGLVIAEYLAEKFNAKVALIGRSPLPARSGWDSWLSSHGPDDPTSAKLLKLQRIEAVGGQVMTFAADVADLAAMREVVEEVRSTLGTVNGVFHAAGHLDDDLIQLKTQTAIDSVFAPKIQGSMVLDDLFGGDLEFMVLFSSTSSILGAVGQVDYVAANAYLNAFAASRTARTGSDTIAINWGVWNEVGMAARAAGDDEPAEVPLGEAIDYPLLDGVTTDGEEVVFTGRYEAHTRWLLDEHRTRDGQALVPGTGFVELCRGAFAQSQGPGPLEISDLLFLSPLAVDDDEVRSVRVRLHRGNGAWDVNVESKNAAGASAAEWTPHSQGKVKRAEPESTEPLPLREIEGRCGRVAGNGTGEIRTRQEDHLAFGPRWRCLRAIHWGEGEALAQLELPEDYRAELDSLELHPALMDLATGYAMELIEGYDGAQLYVPVSYRRARVHAPLTPSIYSYVRNAGDNRASGEIATFDIVITDPTGQVLVEIDGFSIKKIASGGFGRVEKPPASIALDESEHLSPAERVFRRTLAAGILPAEGIEALDRVLSGALEAQVVVTSIDLDTLVTQVEAAAPAPAEEGARFSRPNLASDYVAPRNDVEKTLVALWEELLGVDEIGVQDNFFELGGHSLIAVRFFAEVTKQFNADYPISVLFEAPTVEKLAAMVSDRMEDSGAGEDSVVFKHLVPMHTASDEGKTPVFLVAGMFGNVMNLRHLAGIVGRDRPFYSIQARGLHGDEQPHDRFPEMAADYLEEVRAVQPHGPYLLGGFSGGGLTAYEMAQQLRNAGEEVGLLMLLDTPLAKSPLTVTTRDKILIHWQRLRRRGFGYVIEWVRNRISRKRQGGEEPDGEAIQPYEFRSKVLETAFRTALEHYETHPYSGRVVLYRPKLPVAYVLGPGRLMDEGREFLFEDNGWHHYIEGGVEVIEVPGDHDAMVLEPNVRVLAAKMREAIEQADSAGVPGQSATESEGPVKQLTK